MQGNLFAADTPESPPCGPVVYSTLFGTSAEAFPQILDLWVPDGAWIADLTCNRGVFWKQVPLRYQIVRSDIAPEQGIQVQADLRSTPYRDDTFDCVVIDPPYGNHSTTPRRDGIKDSYNLETCLTPQEVRALYLRGIDEAHRILRIKGLLIVKCQNGVNGGRKIWHSEALWAYANGHGFIAEDRFTMVPPSKPMIRHPDRRQQHSREWGSVFWVFRKWAR